MAVTGLSECALLCMASLGGGAVLPEHGRPAATPSVSQVTNYERLGQDCQC